VKLYQFLKWLGKYTKTDMVYVTQGSFWWILGRIFGFFCSFLILVAFAHFATKEVYGTYQYVISTAGIIGILGLPGISTALVRAVAQGKEKTFFLCEKVRLRWGILATCVSFLISGWYFLHQNFILAISFLIVGVFLPFLYIFVLYTVFWQGRKKFDIQNRYFIFHNSLASSFLILTIFLTRNLIVIILAYFFFFTFANFLFWLKSRRKIKKDTEIDKETISFGKHLTVMTIPEIVAGQIDKIILWQVAGSISVAIYVYALRLIKRLQELIPFSPLALPKMAEKNLKEGEIKRKILDKFLKLFLISVPLSFSYIIFCPLFFKIFFPNYTESVVYSQILALILILSPFSFLATAFVAEAKKKELYILNSTPEILRIILFLTLIPLFGIWGAVFSILISQIFYSGLTLYLF
jgi:O-antigen/teichoic acid export membrane protein